MSNVPWISRWQRSPRQDRRVVENGKFVELGQVQLPELPLVEEQVEVNTALEVVHEQVNSGASAGGDVQTDASLEVRGGGIGTVEQSNEQDQSTETGIAQNISDSSVSAPEEQPLPQGARRAVDGGVVTHEEIVRGEEILDAVAEHEKGSQTVAEIAQALEPLPGDVLTEEQSDALTEVLRLPEPTEDNDIPF